MPVNRYLMPVIVIVALLGTVMIAQAVGVWSTSGRTTVDMNSLSAADIKGWMTLQQVADGLGIPLADVYAAGAIPADVAPETALKDLEGLVEGFETSLLRYSLAVGAEAEPIAEATAAQAQATLAPTPQPTQTPEYTPEHTANPQGDTYLNRTPPPSSESPSVDEIKGKMTLQQVSDQYAVELSALLAALNLPPDTNINLALKDLVAQGLLDEVTQVKDVVTALKGQ